MKIALRSIIAVLSAVGTYFLYISFPKYLIQYFDGNFEFHGALVSIGSTETLVFYVTSIGYMLIGLTFAHQFAPDKSKIKAIWHLLKVFFKIIFLGLFIFVQFTTIDVEFAYNTEMILYLTINLEVLFWVMMGGIIFDIILTILDFFIAFFPEKKEPKAKASNTTQAYSAEEF